MQGVDNASRTAKYVTSVVTVLTVQMRPTVHQNVTSKPVSANGQMLRLATSMTGSEIRAKPPQNSLDHLLTTPTTPLQVGFD